MEEQKTPPAGMIFEAHEAQAVNQPVVPGVASPPVPFVPKAARKIPTRLLVSLGAIVFLVILVVVVMKLVIPNVSGPTETKIVWWSLEEDAEAVQPIIDAYKQKKPNVKIEFVKQSAIDYRERLANALSKNQGPDIFEFHNSWVAMFSSNLVATKEDFSSVFYPVVATNLKSKNGFLGMPVEYDGIALFINEDIFQAYGKSAPRTWDDLKKIANEMTLRGVSGEILQSGVALGRTENVDYWQDVLGVLMIQNGADLVRPASVRGQSALGFFTDFSKKDRVWDETLPTSTIDFGSGKLAMYFGKYADVFKMKRQNPNLHFGVFPLPQLAKNEATDPSFSYASYWVNGVSTKSKVQNEAWDFVKYVGSKENLEELYKNEVKVRGYGNLYPRVDMQSMLLTDPIAGAFIYQAPFAQSWYLAANTNDGPTGINSQIGKYYQDAVNAANLNTGSSDKILEPTQLGVQQVLASYGLIALPKATPQ